MPKPKRKTVKVILESSGPPVKFRLDSDLLSNGKLNFKNKNHPGFTIEFKLDDEGGTGYLFPDDPDLALAAMEITDPTDVCPGQGTTWPQFHPVAVLDDNKTLQVHNLNSFEAKFGYTLFVTRTPASGPYQPLDPIGENSNGPRTRSVATVLVGTAAVALVTALVVTKLAQ